MTPRKNLGIGPEPLTPLRLLQQPDDEGFDFVPLGPQAAAHIEDQNEMIYQLASVLMRIVGALDLDEVDVARELAAETLQALRRASRVH